jgi:hypothetical protein
MHRALVELLQIRRNLRRALGECQRRRFKLGERKRARRIAPLGSFRPGHGVAGQHQFHCPPHADHPRMKLHVGRAHQPYRRIADLRILGDKHHVARGRKLRAAGKAVAVHLRDHRLCKVPDGEPAVDHVARPLSRARRGVIRLALPVVGRQIIARREAWPGAAYDHDRDGRIAIGLLQRLQNLLAQKVAQRVALFRTIERDPPDMRQRIVDEDMDRRRHGALP